MCLRNFKKIKIEEPITVYKVLVRCGDSRCGYCSPYYFHLWEVGNTYINENEIEEKNCELGGGLFHTFKYKEDAICDIGVFKMASDKNYVIGRFTIPTDAEVYTGECGIGEISYASTKLKLEEISEVDDDTILNLRKVRFMLYVPRDEKGPAASYLWKLSKEEFDIGVKIRKDAIKNDFCSTESWVERQLSDMDTDTKWFYNYRNWK